MGGIDGGGKMGSSGGDWSTGPSCAATLGTRRDETGRDGDEKGTRREREGTKRGRDSDENGDEKE
ncbi:hypothetical protein E2C01_054668 [Portunus trituberculatus]|uniref:Uncharacterized protein n=1 Tax=Portunus trituberculatus TaxID=210409 RepID=A0A5B7GTA8_PORTR|nr:hypothetical protein [Portunus trituberculatus]